MLAATPVAGLAMGVRSRPLSRPATASRAGQSLFRLRHGSRLLERECESTWPWQIVVRLGPRRHPGDDDSASSTRRVETCREPWSPSTTPTAATCASARSPSSSPPAAQHDFALQHVDIGGDPVLEARYRELIPVVVIDGEVAFTYFVPPDAFRDRLIRARAPE